MCSLSWHAVRSTRAERGTAANVQLPTPGPCVCHSLVVTCTRVGVRALCCSVGYGSACHTAKGCSWRSQAWSQRGGMCLEAHSKCLVLGGCMCNLTQQGTFNRMRNARALQRYGPGQHPPGVPTGDDCKAPGSPGQITGRRSLLQSRRCCPDRPSQGVTRIDARVAGAGAPRSPPQCNHSRTDLGQNPRTWRCKVRQSNALHFSLVSPEWLNGAVFHAQQPPQHHRQRRVRWPVDHKLYNLKWRNIWFRDVFWPQYLG